MREGVIATEKSMERWVVATMSLLLFKIYKTKSLK